MNDYLKLEKAVQRIVRDVRDAMSKAIEKYPNFDRSKPLHLPDLPSDLLNGAMVKTLLRFQYRKKKGDKGFSSLSVEAAKEMWRELSHRPVHSVKDHLTEERGYDENLVLEVLETAENPTIKGTARPKARIPHLQATAAQPLPNHNSTDHIEAMQMLPMQEQELQNSAQDD